jgi:hypothetical protein
MVVGSQSSGTLCSGPLYVTRNAPIDSGQTCAVFRDDDKRSPREIAFARAVFLIGAVGFEPGIVGGKALFCADGDVQKAQMLADAGKFSVLDASEHARDLCASETFRKLHARVTDAMLRKTHLDERELAKLLR